METNHSISFPTKVHSAFASLIVKHAQPSQRVAEFVRVGVTAYDYTLTYSDTFMLLHYAQPKPKDMGNMFEGFHRYLNKVEWAGLPEGARGCRVFPALDVEEYEEPFQHDLLAPLLKDGALTGGKGTDTVLCDPHHILRVVRAFDSICGLDKDKRMRVSLQADGRPIVLVANSEGYTLRGIVMPCR